MPPLRYRKPGWFLARVNNPVMAFLAGSLGIGLRGMRLLTVPGRRSGAMHTTPVNLLEHEGRRYLVAPRGQTQWVRNLRAAGGGQLRLGRKTEAIRVMELADDAKPPVLRAYLRRWKMETGRFFHTGPNAGDADFRRIAPHHPVFRILG
jgi:deazaflavin-dependent oxidoreductase (nitroreductase family)